MFLQRQNSYQSESELDKQLQQANKENLMLQRELAIKTHQLEQSSKHANSIEVI